MGLDGSISIHLGSRHSNTAAPFARRSGIQVARESGVARCRTGRRELQQREKHHAGSWQERIRCV